MSLDARSIRSDFPQLAAKVREANFVYLDNAATTLIPRVVAEAMFHYDLSARSNVHRGAHHFSDHSTTLFERARERVANFIGAKDPSGVIFTRGTTESINLVAQSYVARMLSPGDEILISEMEHHSNIVPWQVVAQERGLILKAVPVTAEGDLDLREFERLLTPKVKFVSLVYCSNALGTVNPVEKIIPMVQSVGAKVLLDAAQAVAAMPVNVESLGCDFLAFSGHKLFGPFGIGVLWGRPELLNRMPPYQGGGSMISTVTLQHTDYLPAPQRFEAGTPNVTGAIGLAAAIDYLSRHSWSDIMAHEKALLGEAKLRLKDIPGLRWVGTPVVQSNILSFVIDGLHPSDIGQVLDQQGIAIRAGHHCAQPLMRRFGLTGTARASFSIYNTMDDVEALHRGVLKAKELLA